MVASDPTYPLFPVLSFLGFVLSIVPLSWHFQAWNSGTCAFMIWTGLVCLVTCINSIIWADNALNVAPVWCDICECLNDFPELPVIDAFAASQIILGASVGIPASTLCISRRLYRIVSTQTVSITRDDVSLPISFPNFPRVLTALFRNCVQYTVTLLLPWVFPSSL